MLDALKPAVCLDLLRFAAAGFLVNPKQFAELHAVSESEILDALADLALVGVVVCRATGIGGVLLGLGPKAVQAVYLFALNSDMPGEAG